MPYFPPTASSTLVPSAMISGPMPSPGSRQMLYSVMIARPFRSARPASRRYRPFSASTARVRLTKPPCSMISRMNGGNGSA